MSSKERRGGAKSNRTRSTLLNAGSPSSVQHVEKLRVCQKVIEQLCEDWPELKADEARKAKVHDLIVRLPRQYGLDAHHLEDIETHVTLLERASTKGAPVVHVREVLVGGDEESEKSDEDVEDEDEKSNREDTSMSSAPQEGSEYSSRHQSQAKPILRQNSQQQSLRGLRKPIFGSSATLSTFQGYAGGNAGGSPNSRDGSMNGNSIDSNTSTTRSSLEGTYEIAVCGGNKPRTLSRISTTLFDVGLNIAEAHVFCTSDGFVLDVFVAQGWRENDAKGLETLLQSTFDQLSWGDAGSPNAKMKQLQQQKSSGAVDAVPAHPQQKSGEQGQKKSGGSSGRTRRALMDERSISPMPSEWEIDEKLLTYSEKIAQGAFGVLYLGQYCGQEVAVKVLKTPKNENHDDVKREFQQELSTLRKVHHKNVIQLIGAITKGPMLCLVTEFMHGGSMLSFLHKHAPLRLSQIVKYSTGVALGLDYLHKINIVHRDVKTANLLMDENDVVKIADFGVARVMANDGVMTAETGTYRWMAPEVIAHQVYNHKCDVYSFAITLWELITGGDIPYSGYTPLQAAVGVVQRGMRPTIPQSCHQVLAHTIQYSWQADMNTRPEFEQIVEMLRDVNVADDGKKDENNGLMSRFRSMGFAGNKKRLNKASK
jgi:tRNA A-37 threonylcarbamoyl transferase component Bud32